MELAASLLRHSDAALPWHDALRVGLPQDLESAYAVALQVRALRAARGERPAGFKVGFTNRTIWQRYQVFAPIWGSVWDTTLQRSDGHGRIAIDGLCEPRLEPEIVFVIASMPPPRPTLQQLFECIDEIAPGFEVVQSHCPAWRFNAVETVVDGGLHGRLLVGRSFSARLLASDGESLDARLAGMNVKLLCDGRLIESGQGTNVLDGPLHALLHFVHELERCPGAPSMKAGDVVTTGTWTDAWPVTGGQRWRAVFDAPVGELEVSFDSEPVRD
jgi:2-oxo-3-hexenedioate decarboxylase